MPVASVQGCGRPGADCLRHFLLSLGFEARCEPLKAEVAVAVGDDVECWPLESARVVVADRLAAHRCGGDLAGAAASLDPPDSVRVLGRGKLVFHGPEALFLVMRELPRLLEWNRLLYRTPPLTREDVLRHKP